MPNSKRRNKKNKPTVKIKRNRKTKRSRKSDNVDTKNSRKERCRLAIAKKSRLANIQSDAENRKSKTKKQPLQMKDRMFIEPAPVVTRSMTRNYRKWLHSHHLSERDLPVNGSLLYCKRYDTPPIVTRSISRRLVQLNTLHQQSTIIPDTSNISRQLPKCLLMTGDQGMAIAGSSKSNTKQFQSHSIINEHIKRHVDEDDDTELSSCDSEEDEVPIFMIESKEQQLKRQMNFSSNTSDDESELTIQRNSFYPSQDQSLCQMIQSSPTSTSPRYSFSNTECHVSSLAPIKFQNQPKSIQKIASDNSEFKTHYSEGRNNLQHNLQENSMEKQIFDNLDEEMDLEITEENSDTEVSIIQQDLNEITPVEDLPESYRSTKALKFNESTEFKQRGMYRESEIRNNLPINYFINKEDVPSTAFDVKGLRILHGSKISTVDEIPEIQVQQQKYATLNVATDNKETKNLNLRDKLQSNSYKYTENALHDFRTFPNCDSELNQNHSIISLCSFYEKPMEAQEIRGVNKTNPTFEKDLQKNEYFINIGGTGTQCVNFKQNPSENIDVASNNPKIIGCSSKTQIGFKICNKNGQLTDNTDNAKFMQTNENNMQKFYDTSDTATEKTNHLSDRSAIETVFEDPNVTERQMNKDKWCTQHQKDLELSLRHLRSILHNKDAPGLELEKFKKM